MIKSTRRAMLGAFLTAPALRHAHAAWPERGIRLVVPVAPGGSQDLVARLSARAMTDLLGQPVTVENLPGGGSTIGYAAVARAAPDGYTLLAGADTLSITGAVTPGLTFDPLGFAPIHRTVRVPQILVVRADNPAADFRAWLGTARGAPPAVGSPGNATLAHLLIEQISRATDTRWTHVPYRGGSLAVNDLLGGTLQAVVINIGAVTEHVRAGRFRGLFVSSETRSTALPDVPTLGEVGLRDYAVTGWHGLVAPPGTDPAIIARLNAASRAAVKRQDILERLASLGVEPTDEAPEVLGQAIRTDAARFADVVRRYGVRSE